MFIVPAILVTTVEELQQQVSSVKDVVEWLQLDIADGKFVDNKTISLADIPDNIFDGFSVEVHLMVENPMEYLEDCKRLRVKRIIVHYEAIHEKLDVLEKINQSGIQISIAINPGTTVSYLENVIEYLDAVLLMTVEPGKQGQEFIPSVLDKISEIRLIAPDAVIGIDGGVKLDNINKVNKYNLDYVAVGSGLWQADDIEGQIKKFQQA